ncbi:hypothetical protein HYW67_02110 [Candidatus Parcubacteria bacterium]|nr:hypothetical protein [Candidatus Parcubacteria bacterium]
MLTLALAGVILGLSVGMAIGAYAGLAVGGETDELTEYRGQFWVGEETDGMDPFNLAVCPTVLALGGGTRRSDERRA